MGKFFQGQTHASNKAQPSRDETCSRRRRVPFVVRGGMVILLLMAILLMEPSHVSGHLSDGGDGGSNAAPGGSSGDFIPTFQHAACPFTVGAGLVEGQQVSCGYVSVPENHASPTGKMVRLAVAIFRAPQYMHSVDPAPVLRLEGGPGGSSLDALARFITAQNYRTLIFDHDLILFDQRGVGYSTPLLDCPEITTIATNPLVMDIKTVRTCYDRLVAEGINLSNFTTLQNAADVADLIHALGYRQMTLYGVSYGTRLALTVLRLYPQVVRATVLDSVYPPTHNRDELASAAQRAFTLLFQRCAQQAACNAKYPHLQSVFYRLVDELNAHPIRFTYTIPGTKEHLTIASYSGNNLITAIYANFYVSITIPFLPNLIYQVKAQAEAHPSVAYSAAPASVISWGMFFSTECSEDWSFLTEQDILNSLQGVTPQLAKVFGAREQSEYHICQFWKVRPVPVVQKQPVFSALPALVLAGEYDQITPPSNGREVAHDLSNSVFFLFPNVGHGVLYSSTCADQIISAFENHPDQRPKSACLAQMPETAFF